MNWATLIEVECDKDIKIKDPTPKPEVQASPIILGRVTAAIERGRQRVDAQAAKLAKAKAKVGKAKTDKAKHKAEVSAACEALRVKAREADLEFSLNRWKNLEVMAKENLAKEKETRANLIAKGKPTDHVDETIAKIEAWLHFGGSASSHGQDHLANHGNEDFKPGPMLGISYNYGKSKLLGPDGNEFDPISCFETEKEKAKTDAVMTALAPEPSLEPATEPVVAGPKSVDDLSASETAKLKADLKTAFLTATSKGNFQWTPGEVFEKAGVIPPPAGTLSVSVAEQHASALYYAVRDEATVKSLDDLDIEEATKLVSAAFKAVSDQMKADVAAGGTFKKIATIKALRAASVAALGDKRLNLKVAKTFVDQAVEKWYSVPKPYNAYTPEDQAKIKAKAKSLAIKKAFVVAGVPQVPDVATLIKQQLSADGLGISSAAAMTLSAATIDANTNKAFGALPADKQQAILAVAQKASDKGQSVVGALQQAEIAHLDSASMKEVADKVAAKADEPGFLKAIEKHLKDIPGHDIVPFQPEAVISHIDQFGEKPFIALMSEYHIPKVKSTPLEGLIKTKAIGVVSSRWSPEKIAKIVQDNWDWMYGEHKAKPSKEVAISSISSLFSPLPSPGVTKAGGWPEAIKALTDKHFTVWVGDVPWPPWSEKWDQEHKNLASKEEIDAFTDEVMADPQFLSPGVIPSGTALHAKVKAWAADHLDGDTNAIVDALLAKSAKATIDTSSEEELGAASISINATETGDTEPKPLPTTPALPTVSGKTKVTKISKAHHLTGEQKKLLATLVASAIGSGAPFSKTGKLKSQLGGVAGTIAKQFKDAHLAVGTKLAIGKPLVLETLKKGLTGIKHSDWMSYQTYKALPDEAIAQALTTSQLNALQSMISECFLQETHQKKKGGGYYGGPFENKKQKQYFNELISKCEAVASAPVELEAVAGPGGEVHGSSLSVVELFGMSKPDLDEYAGLGPVAGTTMAPAIGKGWTSSSSDLDDSGGSEGSTKKFLSATLDGKQHTGAGKAPAQFLFKHDGYRALGEAAANRTQALLGLGGVGTDGYVMSRGGKTGFMQFFRVTKNLRRRYGHHSKPWLGLPGSGMAGSPEDERKRLAQGLQLALVSNWLVDDKDDHGGNYTFDENDQVTGIDHGQSCKFFDSGGTLLSHWDWSTGKIANKDSKATLESNKGWPKRMLMDWAAGADLGPDKTEIPLLALTDPAFEKMIQRAEGIPDDVYDKMWRPYAEGADAAKSRDGEQRLARYSHNPKDRTVEGFIDGMQQRRKTIRKQVADLFSMLAKKRAQALAAHGDTRPLPEIEAEVREQLGLDRFAAGGGAITDKQADKMSPSAEEIAAGAEAPGWDESKLPESSHMPTSETIAKWGVKGYDMSVGGDAIKGGAVTFRQLGEVPIAQFMLDGPARATLEARLPGFGGTGPQPPPKPADPAIPTFKEPPVPSFSQSPESLATTALTGDDPHNFTGIALKGLAGDRLTKIEKYVNKWRDGKLSPPKGSKYWVRGLEASRKMKTDADPIVAAAGAHYEKELLKFGAEGGPDGFTFADPATVPEEERLIKPFEPTEEQKAAQEAAKANVEAAHKKAVADAKVAHDKQVEKIKADHEKALANWQTAMKKFEEEQGPTSTLTIAKKMAGVMQPGNAKHHAADNKTASMGADWDGSWTKWYGAPGNHQASWEIDLTDVVSQLGAVATGEKDSRFKIVYSPGTQSSGKSGKHTGLDGTTFVQFPKGSTTEQNKAMLKKAFEVLGIDARPASAEDHELNYVRKMAWLLGVEGASGTAATDDARWHVVEPSGGTRKERTDFWLKKLKSHLGYDPRHAPELDDYGRPKTVPGSHGKVIMKEGPDGGPVPNPYYQPIAAHSGGQVSHRRPDFTDEEMVHMMKAGRQVFTQHSGAARKSKILQGMFLSTRDRHLSGIEKQLGASESGDLASGGGMAAFLYNRETDRLHQKGNVKTQHPVRMVVHPAILLRTNNFSAAGDTFGSKKSGYRHKTLAEATLVEILGAHSSTAELMVEGGLDVFEYAMFYKDDEPGKLCAALAEAGIKKIGMPKRPCKQVIKKSITKSMVNKLLDKSADAKDWATA